MIRVGDWYKSDGNIVLMTEATPVTPANTQIVTVREFFEAIGCKIPEGARIVCCYVGDYALDPYWVWRTETRYNSELGLSENVEDMPEGDDSWLYLPDLSRLPLSDAWDCLPEDVKDKFVKKVKE